MKEEPTIRWMVKATYEVDHKTGKVQRVAQEYADIPADTIAQLFLSHFSKTNIQRKEV